MYTGKPFMKTYFESLKEGKILASKCPECGSIEYPPLPTCNQCGCLDMEIFEISDKGMCTALGPHGDRFHGYNGQYQEFGSAVIELEEGKLPITGAVLGVTAENCDGYVKKMPFPVKAETRELVGVWRVFWIPEED